MTQSYLLGGPNGGTLAVAFGQVVQVIPNTDGVTPNPAAIQAALIPSSPGVNCSAAVSVFAGLDPSSLQLLGTLTLSQSTQLAALSTATPWGYYQAFLSSVTSGTVVCRMGV